MTTAIQDVVKEDLTTPADPFDMGSGRIDIGTAGSARSGPRRNGAQNFFALGGDELNAVHLNLPSINIPTLPGELSTTRTVTNVGTAPARYEVSTSTPAGTTISVPPRSFNLAPGHSKELEITISTRSHLRAAFRPDRPHAEIGGIGSCGPPPCGVRRRTGKRVPRPDV